MVYILSSGGFSSVVREVCDKLEITYFFPCKGYGCHCDVIGKELPNCSCDHTSEASVECCSTIKVEVLSVEDTSCCSDPVLNLNDLTSLDKIGCGGLEEDSFFLALKHVEFDRDICKSKSYSQKLANIPETISFLSKELINKIHKVPISILS